MMRKVVSLFLLPAVIAACAGSPAPPAGVSQGNAPGIFARTCLAALGDFSDADARFVAEGMNPRGGEFVDSSGRIVGALSSNKRGCAVTEINRDREGYTAAEEEAFVAALRRVDPNARAQDNGTFAPFARQGGVFVPFLKSEGSVAGGDARLIHGILRAL